MAETERETNARQLIRNGLALLIEDPEHYHELEDIQALVEEEIKEVHVSYVMQFADPVDLCALPEGEAA